ESWRGRSGSPQASLPCGGSVEMSRGRIPCRFLQEKSNWQTRRMAQITTPLSELQSPAPVAKLRAEVIADVVGETGTAMIHTGHDIAFPIGKRPRDRPGILRPNDGVGTTDQEARSPPRPDAIDVAHRIGSAEVRGIVAEMIEDRQELCRRRQPGGVEQ